MGFILYIQFLNHILIYYFFVKVLFTIYIKNLHLFVFVASRCILHIEMYAEGTWETSLKILCSYQATSVPHVPPNSQALSVGWQNSTPLFASSEEIKILNISFPRVYIGPITIVYICTFVLLHHDDLKILIDLQNNFEV